MPTISATSNAQSVTRSALPSDPATARSSQRRKQRLTDYVVAKTGADIEVILTAAIPTAAVTSQSALEEGRDLGLIDQGAIDQLRALAGGSDAEYIMLITTTPANLDRLPFSDQLAADRMQQFGLALHESLHITYTDQHGVNRLIASEIEEDYRETFHGFWNAGEDGAIERLARVNGGDKVEIRQTATHASLRRPASEPPSPAYPFTFADAVMQAMIDKGVYDTSQVDAALDDHVTGWEFRSPGDKAVFEGVFEDLEDLIARIQHEPNCVARAEAMAAFWEEHIQPYITPDDTAKEEQNASGASGDSGESQGGAEDASSGDGGGGDAPSPSGATTSSETGEAESQASGEVTVERVMASPLTADGPDQSVDATDLSPDDATPDATPPEPPTDTPDSTPNADGETEPERGDEIASSSPTANPAQNYQAEDDQESPAETPDTEAETEHEPAEGATESELDGGASPESAQEGNSESEEDDTEDSGRPEAEGETPADDDGQYTLDAFTSDLPDDSQDNIEEAQSDPDSADEPGEATADPDSKDSNSEVESQTETAAKENDAVPKQPADSDSQIEQAPEAMDEGRLNDAESDQEVEEQHARATRDLNADGPDESELREDVDALATSLEGGDSDLGEIEFMPPGETPVDPARWNGVLQDGQRLAQVLDTALPDTADTGYRHGTRSGKPSKRRLAGVPVGNTNVFRRRQQPEEKDYDIILVLDRSDSMRYPKYTRERFGIGESVPHPVEVAEETVAAFAVALEQPCLNANVAIVDFYDDTPRLIKPFSTAAEFVKDSLMSSTAKRGTPLTDVTEIAGGWLTERGNDAIIITVTDGQAADVEAFQTTVEDTPIPVAGITLSLHTDHGEPDDDLRENETCFDRHTFVYEHTGLQEHLTRFAYDFIGLNTMVR